MLSYLNRSAGCCRTARICSNTQRFRRLHLAPPQGVTLVTTKDDARRVVKLVEALPGHGYHAWDTETMHIDPQQQSPVGNGKVICASFYSGPDIDYGAGPRVWISNLDESEGVLDEFKGVLESKDIKKVWHNYGFDRHILFNHGIDVQGLAGDTMHMARMWNTARALTGGYGLEGVTADLLQRKKQSMKDLFAKPKLKKDGTPGKELILPPLEDVQRNPALWHSWVEYSTYDAEATWRIREILEEKLRSRPWIAPRSMWDFYQMYIVPFAECLTDMERAGIYVDVKHLLPQAEKLALADRETAERAFIQWATRYCADATRMNVASDVQKAHLLFAPCLKMKPFARRPPASISKSKAAGARPAADIGDEAIHAVTVSKAHVADHPLLSRAISQSPQASLLGAANDGALLLPPAIGHSKLRSSRSGKSASPKTRAFGSLPSSRVFVKSKQVFPTFVPVSRSPQQHLSGQPPQPKKWGKPGYGSSDSDTDQARAIFGDSSDFDIDDGEERVYFMDPQDEAAMLDPLYGPAATRMVKAVKEIAAATSTVASRDLDAWPAERAFLVDNTEKFIEPGKKSPKVKREIKLVGMGIPAVARTESGWPAVSSGVLKVLAGKPEGAKPQYGSAYEFFGGGDDGKAACDAINALYKVSTIDTMLSNFIIPLQMMADADSRVHCSLNLNTETGRLSARRPSLQNQPAIEKDRYGVRKAFMASPGNKLIVADYGQLELRLLAHMTRCKSMIQAFKAGGDFHSRTAMGMYPHVAEAVQQGTVLLEWDEHKGEPPVPLLKNVFSSERRKAKILNFSIAYGKTAMGLAKDWNVSLDEAKETLEKWYSDRPEVRQWQQQVLVEARREKATRTLFGRYRDLPEIVSTQFRLRGHAERAAINTPIQGGAADVAMMAMLKVWRNARLKQLGWTMLLQIHDEIIVEGPAESANEALALVLKDMQHPFENPLLVDLVVDAKIADNWYEAK